MCSYRSPEPVLCHLLWQANSYSGLDTRWRVPFRKAWSTLLLGGCDQSHVPFKTWPACLCVLQSRSIFLDPAKHVKEALRSPIVSLGNWLVSQVANFIQIGAFDSILSLTRNRFRPDPFLSKLFR